VVAIVYDARDFWRLSKAFGRLPAEIKTKVAARAMARVTQMGASRVAKLAGAPQDAGSGVLFQAHLGTSVRTGDVLYTIFAEAGGALSRAVSYAAAHGDIIGI